jgi:hypothetical protein
MYDTKFFVFSLLNNKYWSDSNDFTHDPRFSKKYDSAFSAEQDVQNGAIPVGGDFQIIPVIVTPYPVIVTPPDGIKV